ncbi:hypothetical protein NDU88_004694 [Pleurodeles waltl]|uniref:Uncharacterized protein n=1 Tax=Pleurodeles waltl TaxID=8319 RepID=A0AAV7L0L3_PLEWA|nr:hypothetical protein NDU88_004694 [Pleurodeles waltl]
MEVPLGVCKACAVSIICRDPGRRKGRLPSLTSSLRVVSRPQRCVPNTPGPQARGQPAAPAVSMSMWGHSRPSWVDRAGRRHPRGRPHKRWGYGTSTRKINEEMCSVCGPPLGPEAPLIRRRGVPTMGPGARPGPPRQHRVWLG